MNQNQTLTMPLFWSAEEKAIKLYNKNGSRSPTQYLGFLCDGKFQMVDSIVKLKTGAVIKLK